MRTSAVLLYSHTFSKPQQDHRCFRSQEALREPVRRAWNDEHSVVNKTRVRQAT